MTQAFNLSQLANNVNSSGQVALGSAVSGTLPVANGGTGLSTTPTNGQLNIGNGTGFTRATLTAGTGITVTNGAGSITIATSGGGGGVTSLNGQSGAITNTGYADIGSYAVFVSAINDIANGATVAGSNLRFNLNAGNINLGGLSTFCSRADSSTYDCGGTAPSGTWRRMGGNNVFRTISLPKGGYDAFWYSHLYVRVS